METRTVGCGNNFGAPVMRTNVSHTMPVRTIAPVAVRTNPVVLTPAGGGPATNPVINTYTPIAIAPRSPAPLTPDEYASQQLNNQNLAYQAILVPEQLPTYSALPASYAPAAIAPASDGTDTGGAAPAPIDYKFNNDHDEFPWVPVIGGGLLLAGGIWWFTSGLKKRKRK